MSPAADSQEMAAATRASGSSFYTAMRILPRAQREAMFEIYSFCRQVDDIADSAGPRPERRAALGQWRADIDASMAARRPRASRGSPSPCGNSPSAARISSTVIDGMEMDVVADIRAPDLATLDLYCDRVASAVGRLSVRVFGMAEDDGIALAHHLGRALQLTNILRDLDEDAAIGRLYLPREALSEAGISGDRSGDRAGEPARRRACGKLVGTRPRAFRRGRRDHGAQRTPHRARAAHHGRGLPADPRQPDRARLVAPRARIRIPRARLLWIILRNAVV